MTPFVHVAFGTVTPPAGISILSTTTGQNTSEVQYHDLTFPSGSSVDDSVIFFFNHAWTGGALSTPSGWTLVDSSDRSLVIHKTLVSGDVSTGYVRVDSVNARRSHWVGYRLSGVAVLESPHFEGSDAAHTVSGNPTYPDPATITASWGALAEDNLWFTWLHCRYANNTFTMPSGYSNQLTATSDTTEGYAEARGRIAVATKYSSSASEDAGTWTLAYTTTPTQVRVGRCVARPA